MFSILKKLSSNQCYAIVVLICSIIYGVLGLIMEEGFFSDIVGPNGWVQGVAVLLTILSLFLLFIPAEFVGSFPVLSEWLNRIPFFLIMVVYSYALPFVGFAISTPILMTLVGIFFGARPVNAFISAVCMSVFCYLVFDFTLGISLPSGLWFR